MSEILSAQVKKQLRKLYLKDTAEYLDEALEKAQKKQLGHLSFLADLVGNQLKARMHRSLEKRLKTADFPRNMSFDNYDFNFQPSLNVEYLKDLMELSFVNNRQPLLILGKTGSGKTHISTGLGIRACQANFKVRFYSLQKLLAMLYTSLADDTTDEIIAGLSRLDLLIIDNVGSIRTKPEYPSLLLDLVSSCHGDTTFIVNSAISLEEWGSVLGNPSITNAIVDRLLHRAGVINFKDGRSYRTEGPDSPSIPANKTFSNDG